jgi:hypothetical protein
MVNFTFDFSDNWISGILWDPVPKGDIYKGRTETETG